MKQSEGEQLNKVKPAAMFCKGCHGYGCCLWRGMWMMFLWWRAGV